MVNNYVCACLALHICILKRRDKNLLNLHLRSPHFYSVMNSNWYQNNEFLGVKLWKRCLPKTISKIQSKQSLDLVLRPWQVHTCWETLKVQSFCHWNSSTLDDVTAHLIGHTFLKTEETFEEEALF